MPIESSGEVRLRGTAGDGRTDINEEINGNATDTNVSLGTLNTVAFAAVSDGSVTTGRAMSEMQGYSAFDSPYPSTEAAGALGESLTLDGTNYTFYNIPEADSNRKTFTASAWYKFHKTDHTHIIFETGNTSGSGYVSLRIENTTNKVYGLLSPYGGNPWLARTEGVLIDTTGWYNFVFAVDTTSPTLNHRLRLWVNGVEVHFVYTANSTSQNQDLAVNQTSTRISFGRTIRTDQYAQWSQATVADAKFIDGYQLGPEYFGKLYEGTWIPQPLTTAGTQVTSGLVRDYDFTKGDVTDATGNSNGSHSNMTFKRNNEGVAKYNGSNSYIQFTNPISNSSNTSFTFSTWINFDIDEVSGLETIIGNTSSSAWGPFMINLYASSAGRSCSLERYYSGNQLYSSSYSTVAMYKYKKDTWYNLTVTYEGTGSHVHVYVDGCLIDNYQITLQATGRTQTTTSALGMYDILSSSPREVHAGYFGRTLIYNKVLTSDEVLQQHNADKPKYIYGINGFHLPLNNTSTGSVVSDSNLKVHLDASNNSSYGGSGTTWTDLSSSSNNGTISGASFLSTTNGGVFDFDGSNDYVSLTNSLNTSTKAIEAWFYPDNFSQSGWVLQQGNGQAVENYIRVYSGGIQLRMANVDMTVSYSTSQWFHVVGTAKTGGGFQLYINGQLVDETTSTGSSLSNDYFYVGARYNMGLGSYFDGKIAQVRVYDRVLTGKEIVTNYRATQGNYEQVGLADISGNSRAHTFSNIDSSDHVEDEPLDNYASLVHYPGVFGFTGINNPIHKNGGRQVRGHEGGFISDVSFSTGKWYLEVEVINSTTYLPYMGVTSDYNAGYATGTKGSWVVNASDGTFWNNSTLSSSNVTAYNTYGSSSVTAGTILGHKLDLDGGNHYILANNVVKFSDTGLPTDGSEQFNFVVGFTNDGSNGTTWAEVYVNFGQKPFKYTIPSGYKAWSTKSLPTPAINPNSATPENPSDYFKAITYQGVGGQLGTDYGYKVGSKAAIFNGSNSYITMPAIDIFSNTARVSFSVSFWFKSTSTGNNALVTDYPATNYSFFISLEGGVLKCGNFYSGGFSGTIAGSTTVNDGDWHHAVLVNNTSDNTQKVYLDGNSTPEISTTLGSGTKSSSTLVVGYFVNLSYYYSGTLDELRIYSDVLTTQEISYIYNDTTASIPTDNLKAHYKFEDNANDAIGFTGKIGKAVRIDGSNYSGANGSGRIYVPVISGITSSTGMSLSTWIYLKQYPASGIQIVIISMYGQFGFNVGINSGGYLQYSGSGSSTQSTAQVPLNAWTHIGTTLTANGNHAYWINGSAAGTSSGSSNLWNNVNTQNTISSYREGNGTYYYGLNGPAGEGYVDETRYYSSILTTTDFNNLYNLTTASYPTSNLQALYKFDGDLTDSSGNGYNATADLVSFGYDATESNITYTDEEPVSQIHTGFEPGLVWTKALDATASNSLFDVVRGTHKTISTESASSETDHGSYGVTRFNSDGFSLLDVASGNYGVGGAPGGTYSGSNARYSAFVWKAGGPAVTNSNGNITSQVSANTTAGFSIIKYTGNEQASQTVAHGLGGSPEIAIIKQLDGGRDWTVPLFTLNSGDYMQLNSTGLKSTDTNRWSAVSSTTFTVGADPYTNGTGSPYIGYFFRSIEGYQKIGTYNSNNNADGPFVYLGFRPAWLLIKKYSGTNYSSSDHWFIYDNARHGENPASANTANVLAASSASAENAVKTYNIDFLHNGFKLSSDGEGINWNGDFIYLAIAEDPAKYSNAYYKGGKTSEFVNNSNKPTKNFNTLLYSGLGATQYISGLDFTPDFIWVKKRSSSSTANHNLTDTVTGIDNIFYSDLTNGKYDGEMNSYITGISDKGIRITDNAYVGQNSQTFVAWNWKAAGQPKRSAKFKGASSSANKIVIPDLTMPTNNYSVSAWIWLEDLSGYNMILTTAKTNGGGYFYFTVSGHQLVHYANTSAGENITSAANTIKAGQWIHCVVTKSSTDGTKLYIDNSLADSQSSHTGNNNTNTTSGGQHTIGGYNTGSSQTDSLHGQISMLRIFNKAISATEVGTLYNETLAQTSVHQVLGDTSCIATYRLDGDARDLSGNHHGQVSDVPFQYNSHYTYNILENKSLSTGHKESAVSSITSGSYETDAINANRDNGFSIITYEGTGSQVSISHGLAKTPELIIIKRTDGSNNWSVYSSALSVSHTKYPNWLYLNLNSAQQNSSSSTNHPMYNRPDKSLVYLNTGSSESTNVDDGKYVMYCWHSVPGYSKIHYFEGANATLSVTGLGFRPAWVMIKNIDGAGPWVIHDKKRAGDNTSGIHLRADSSAGDDSGAGEAINFDEDGFTITYNGCGNINCANNTFIYMAFAD